MSWTRAGKWIGGGIAAILLALLLAAWAIDTGPGHRFVADRIAALRPQNGLRIRIGRIDGSVYGAARLRGVRLSDDRGLWLEAPEIALDWRPAAWLANRLDIRSLTSGLVILHRLPRFRPTEKRGAILPGFDIAVGRLDARIRLEPAVAGGRRLARLTGKADIHGGRALVQLAARAAGGDRLTLLVDAAPDRDRFDIDARLAAPSGGTVGGMVGTKRPIALALGGDGSWRRWRGAGRLQVGAVRAADLRLTADGGRYGLDGFVAPAPLVLGKKRRLSAPRVAVTGAVTLAARRLAGRLALASPALSLAGHGTIDLAESAFDGLVVDARLLRPAALFPNMSGRGLAATMRLDGPFASARFAWKASAPRLAFDRTGFEAVTASGAGRLSKAPVAVPIRFAARRVTGVGDVAGGILANLRVDGVLKVTATRLTGEGLRLDSDKLKGRLGLLVDLVTGRYDVSLSGGLARYLIPGLGIVDVTSELKVVPGPGGRGTMVTGRGRAWVRRFDNAFLAGLAGGLPRIDTGLIRDPDGTIRFTGLVLTAPAIRLAGTGMRRRDGTFRFSGRGSQATYGPLVLALDGAIDRPRLDLLLARPADALGLAQVRARLDPTPQGYGWTAAGGSTLGPFSGNGAILLPRGGAATVQVAALDVTGTRATGALRSDPGGFTGRLDIAGGGLSGTLGFAPAGQVQRIEAHLKAAGATLAGVADLAVRRGALDGAILLDPAGTGLAGTASGQGLRRGGISLASLTATARLRGGRGEVRADLAGSRGRAFAFRTVTTLAPGAVTLTGGGSVDGRPLALTSPARLTAQGGAWTLAETGLSFAGGAARVAGRFGGAMGDRLEASLDRLPLTVLDIGYPGLGLGGLASGRIGYAQGAGGAAPAGRADLRVAGLTRAGLVLSSQPVDVGLAAVLDGRGAVARTVVSSGGKVIGRGQARIAPLAAGGDLAARLTGAPLFAQVRYDGPADILWRLTGAESVDLSGPVAIGADIGGTLAKPAIRGSLRTAAARLESTVTGTVLTGLAATGRFGGSRLVIDRFSATAGGGTVAGRAAFDLAGAHGLAMDIALDATGAVLLDRDDIGATVTGPLTLRSDGRGGTIGGDVTLTRGRFRLGRAAAAAIPNLAVREINRPADEAEVRAPPAPWTLALKAVARNRLAVTGLGLDSEWRADLAIAGTPDAPRISGRADLVRGGYEFAGRRFDLDRGMIRFTGASPVDPVLDIVAQANIQGLNATIRVSGTGLRPDIAFTSVPALPEDELLSRLLFGTSITNLSAPEALQLAAAVASLRNGGGGTGLDPINAIRKVARLDRLRILPADVTTGQRTSVAAGKYIGRRTYVEVITDGQGYSATRIEFQITRWLSLLSTLSTIGRQSANVRVSRDY